MAEAEVTALYRYPVKGFSAERLHRVEIDAGGTVPFDRAFAIENGASGFDPADPRHFPKTRFLMLMRNERMAEVATSFDPATERLSIFRDGALLADGSLSTEAGRNAIERWLSENFRDELRGAPRILSAPGHSFSDKKAKVLHLVNLASVRHLEQRLERRVDPLRFRPNVVIDGPPAWSELEWKGHEIGFSNLRCVCESRTARCAATEVDPETGKRDIDVPQVLERLHGHTDFGVYLTAKTKGTIAIGDRVDAPAPDGISAVAG